MKNIKAKIKANIIQFGTGAEYYTTLDFPTKYKGYKFTYIVIGNIIAVTEYGVNGVALSMRTEYCKPMTKIKLTNYIYNYLDKNEMLKYYIEETK